MEDEINDILQLIDQNNNQGLRKDDFEEEEESSSKQTMNDEINSTDKEVELSPPSDSNFDQSTLYAINHECSLNLKFRQSLKLWREKNLAEMIRFDITYKGYDKALIIINVLSSL